MQEKSLESTEIFKFSGGAFPRTPLASRAFRSKETFHVSEPPSMKPSYAYGPVLGLQKSFGEIVVTTITETMAVHFFCCITIIFSRWLFY